MFDKCLFLRRLFLVSGMLAFNVSAYGEVLIINTQTLDPATLTVQPSTSNVGTKGRSAQTGSGKKRGKPRLCGLMRLLSTPLRHYCWNVTVIRKNLPPLPPAAG